MLEKPQIITIRGSDLAAADLQTINLARRDRLESTYDIFCKPENIDNPKNAWDHLFFLAKLEEQIAAFERLIPVQVSFLDRTYHIAGHASLVSVLRGQSYGQQVLNAVMKHVSDLELTSLGFCDPKMIDYYKSCGLGIIENGDSRFRYPGKDPIGDAAIYTVGSDGLIEKMLQNPNETAILSRPHW